MSLFLPTCSSFFFPNCQRPFLYLCLAPWRENQNEALRFSRCPLYSTVVGRHFVWFSLFLKCKISIHFLLPWIASLRSSMFPCPLLLFLLQSLSLLLLVLSTLPLAGTLCGFLFFFKVQKLHSAKSSPLVTSSV